MQDNCYIVCIEWMYEITVFLLYACNTYQYILVPKKLRVWNRYARIYYCGMITQYITRSYGCRLNATGKGLKFLFLFSHRKRNRNETLYKTFVPDSNTFCVPSPLRCLDVREQQSCLCMSSTLVRYPTGYQCYVWGEKTSVRAAHT